MENRSIKYKFRNFDLVQFATFEDIYHNDNHDLELSCRFSFGYNFVQNILLCSSSIIIKQEGYPLIKSDLDTYFDILDNSNILLEDGSISLPKGFQAKLASFTYDTLRGIIFAKTLNTSLNKLTLPFKDIELMFTEPLILQKV